VSGLVGGVVIGKKLQLQCEQVMFRDCFVRLLLLLTLPSGTKMLNASSNCVAPKLELVSLSKAVLGWSGGGTQKSVVWGGEYTK